MKRRPIVAGAVSALALTSLAVLPASPSSAAPPADAVVTKAVAWLETQQQGDAAPAPYAGSFEVSQFPFFETPDAVLALASAAQTGPEWDRSAALAGVKAVKTTGGKDGLSYLDAALDATPAPANEAQTIALAARSAKLIALVVDPLETNNPAGTGSNLVPTDFDPAGDSASAVDLVAKMDAVRDSDGRYAMGAQFNGVLYAALALPATGRQATSDHVDQIADAQKSDGSWSYDGDPCDSGDTCAGGDVDTTALAILALRVGGLNPTDATITKAVAYLAGQQDAATGGFLAFGSPDPNSTATAITALRSLPVDLSSRAWRDKAAPGRAGEAYANPLTWLRSQQAGDGHIASPNDQYGTSTFATSQALQVISRPWFTDDIRSAFVYDATRVLATKAGQNPSDATAAVASDVLGPDAGVGSARRKATDALVKTEAHRRATANALFLQIMGRPVDPVGEDYWQGRLQTLTQQQMLASLTGSSEYYNAHGATTSSFVQAVYQSVLGRAGDTAGINYWTAKIDAGALRSSVARSFLSSIEFRNRTVTQHYQAILGRGPDAAGKAYWAEQLKTVKVEVLDAGLAASAEFLNRSLPS